VSGQAKAGGFPIEDSLKTSKSVTFGAFPAEKTCLPVKSATKRRFWACHGYFRVPAALG
jgi:hypothetical protein